MLTVGPSGSGGGGGGTVTDILAGPGVVVAHGAGPVVTVSTGPGMSNLLYVSQNGSDVTGTGSFVLPYATYGKAATTATADGAAFENPYAVMFAPGSYAENIVLVPNVDLSGIDSDGDNAVYLNGTIGIGAAWAGATAFTCSVANVRLTGVTNLNFLAEGSTGASHVDFYNCYLGNNFSSEGTSVQDIYLIDCVLHSSALVASDINLITDHCSGYGGSNSLTITAPTFGAGWFSYGTAYRAPVTVNGSAGATAACTLTGTSIFSTLTLNGALATYSSTISGVPALGVVLTGGAVIGQYTILGELPPQNVQPSATNGQFLGTVGGVSQWATVTVATIAGGTPGQVLLTSALGVPTWTTLSGDLDPLSATGVAQVTGLQAGTIGVALNAGNFGWWPGATNPNIFQVPFALTSAGAGLPGTLMSMTAQAGQNATGAGNNGGAGGNLVLASGLGGTSGSAVAGAAGEIDLDVGTLAVLKLGASSVGLVLSSVSINIGIGSTLTLSAAQYLNPVIVFTGNVGVAKTVIFPNLPGLWLVDISAVGGISGTNTLTFESGTASTTPLTSLTTNSNLLMIKTTGANGITINL
jgi:hypothetical protein